MMDKHVLMQLKERLDEEAREKEGTHTNGDDALMEAVLFGIMRLLMRNTREIRRLAGIVDGRNRTGKRTVNVEKLSGIAGKSRGMSGITRREKEVMSQLVEGKTNREISEELGINEKSVKNHLWKIYKKTGVNSRTQLLRRIFYEG
jgi:DNA-binding CsgD family transcriptional regulator